MRPGAPRGDGHTARIEAVLDPSPERGDPACPHYGRCGGCRVQALGPATYARFKRGLVVEALRHRGLGSAPVAEALVSPPASRRRITLAARRGRDGRTVVGFNAAASTEIVPVTDCPVALPALTALLRPLDGAVAGWLAPGTAADLALAAGSSGVELVVRADRSPGLEAREALAAFAEAHDLARVAWEAGSHIEPIAARRPFRVTIAGIDVEPPPGGFLQATAEGERAIQAAVLAALPGHGRVADLFAGCGTLALALARRGARVAAFERDGPALAALGQAARRHDLAVATDARDLDARPVPAAELARFDGIVLDPPRAGAAAQAAELAGANVPVVAMVSCHPGSFARDARTLVDGGYRLESVQPIDQFLWSFHVELVGVFRPA